MPSLPSLKLPRRRKSRAKRNAAAAGAAAGAGAVGVGIATALRRRSRGGDAGEAVNSPGYVPGDRAAPSEAPGPSVPATGAGPVTETERAERADAAVASFGDPLDDPGAGGDIVDREEAAAALEASQIGGPHMHEGHGDPAMDPVYEAGGGEAEGFEESERELIENASHGDGHGQPLRDAFQPEAESDRSDAEYGEGDAETNPDR